jgi:heavy metal sensor kinase
MTFRFKLTLWYSFILALLLFAFGAVLYYSLSRTLIDGIDSSLWFVAETEAASLFDSDNGEPHVHEATPWTASNEGLLDKYVQLLDGKGKVISKSANLGEKQLPSSGELLSSSLEGRVGFETINYLEEGALRLISLPLVDKGGVNYIVQVGTTLEASREILDSFLFQMLGMGLGGLLLAGAGGWFLARRALKPVALITETARAISGRNLDRRLDFEVTPDEIGRLIEVLNDMLQRLEQAFSSRKRFIADASHELRSPLTALKGTMEVLLRRKRTVKEYEQGFESCLEEIDRLARLVNNLLTLARTDTGGEEMRFQEIRLDILAAEVIDRTKALARQKNIRLRSGIEDEIVCHGDPDKLKQLIINLLDNAVRYTPDGGWVKFSLCRKADSIRISVADSGMGIPQDDQRYIFDRFYRVDRSRKRDETGGSGLGLAICKCIAQAHRGRIEVKSEPGRGSMFIVYLPE